MEATSTSTLQNQSSSLMVSCLLPHRSWEGWAGSRAVLHFLPGNGLGTPPEHPSSLRRRKRSVSTSAVLLFLSIEQGDGLG